MSTRTGWIIEVLSGVHKKGRRTFFARGYTSYGTCLLKGAYVTEFRKQARALVLSDKTKIIRKVELNAIGDTVKIIPGR